MKGTSRILSGIMLVLILMTALSGFVKGQDTRAGNTNIVMETNMGTIELELYDDDAPITVENFVKYSEDGFYDGLIFHRVIKDFMIQGGGFTKDMQKKDATYSPIKNEAEESGHRNKRGTIAMARTSDPDSATSQFFINHADNGFLDWDQAKDGVGYCVFGEVTSGMDVVDQIASVETHSEGGHQDVPVQDVVIQSVSVQGTNDEGSTDDGSNDDNTGSSDSTSSTSSSESSSPFYTNILFLEAVISFIVAGVIIFFIKMKKENEEEK